MMRKVSRVVALGVSLIAIVAQAAAPSPQGTNDYRAYANARFNYSITYPANLLIPQGESENGDGQAFRSRDGKTEMRVWGQYNFNNESLRTSFAQTVNEWGKGVSYKVIKSDWFVVTAIVNGKVHYQKTMLHREVFKTFLIEYDEGQRATYDPVTARISKSFAG